MLQLKAQERKEFKKKVEKLRQKGLLPGILYGPKLKNVPLEVSLKEFQKVYQEGGESSLIELSLDKNKYLVLIHALELDPLSQKPIHVDFYQPRLDEEIRVTVPLVFEGESLAVKNMEGTLVRNIQEVEVEALPQKLPHEIKVSIDRLKTFEDSILIKDLVLPEDVKVLREPDEIVALAVPPEKVEEELEKPVEEAVEEVEKVGAEGAAEEAEVEEKKPVRPAARAEATKEKTVE